MTQYEPLFHYNYYFDLLSSRNDPAFLFVRRIKTVNNEIIIWNCEHNSLFLTIIINHCEKGILHSLLNIYIYYCCLLLHYNTGNCSSLQYNIFLLIIAS